MFRKIRNIIAFIIILASLSVVISAENAQAAPFKNNQAGWDNAAQQVREALARIKG